MEALLPAIQKWFAEKEEHLAIFANSDCRLECWFKGELLVFFTQLQRSGVVKMVPQVVPNSLTTGHDCHNLAERIVAAAISS